MFTVFYIYIYDTHMDGSKIYNHSEVDRTWIVEKRYLHFSDLLCGQVHFLGASNDSFQLVNVTLQLWFMTLITIVFMGFINQLITSYN